MRMCFIQVPNVVHNTALPHVSASRNRHHVRVQSACACKASVKSILCRDQCYENRWCPCAPTVVSSQEHCSSVKCAHGALVLPWRHWSCPVRVGPAGFAVRALTREFANCSTAICVVTGVVEHHLRQALFAAHRSEFSPGDRSCGPASHNPPGRVAHAQQQAASKLSDPRDSKFTGTTAQPQQLLQQSTLPKWQARRRSRLGASNQLKGKNFHCPGKPAHSDRPGWWSVARGQSSQSGTGPQRSM